MNELIDHLVSLLQQVESGDTPVTASANYFTAIDEYAKGITLVPRITSIEVGEGSSSTCLFQNVNVSVSFLLVEGDKDSYRKLYEALDSFVENYKKWFDGGFGLDGWLVANILFSVPNGIQVLNDGGKNGLVLEVNFTLKAAT